MSTHMLSTVLNNETNRRHNAPLCMHSHPTTITNCNNGYNQYINGYMPQIHTIPPYNYYNNNNNSNQIQSQIQHQRVPLYQQFPVFYHGVYLHQPSLVYHTSVICM